MQWLTLLFLVPAILVPVVLLFGFSGCAQLAGIDGPTEDPPPPPPTPPTNLSAKAISATSIKLTWVAGDINVNTFEVKRDSGPPTPVTGLTFTDSGLIEGT